MTRDTQSKSSKKEVAKRIAKSEMQRQKRKKDESSDSEYFEGSDSADEEMDVHEYRKFLSKIFPSKHLNKKIKAGEKLKKYASANDEDSESEEEEVLPKKKKEVKKQNKKKVESESEEEWETASEEEEPVKKSKRVYPEKKGKKKQVVESETESDETLGSEDTCSEEDDDEYEDEDDDFIETNKKGANKLNIIFTIGGVQDRDEDDEYDEDYDDEDDSDYVDSQEETENEDESVSSDSETSSSDEEEEKSEQEVKRKNKKPTAKPPKQMEKEKEKEKESNSKSENKSCEEMLLTMKQLLEANPNDKSLMKCIEVYEAEIKRQEAKRSKKTKKQKDKNMRIFKKIIRDKNMMNDFSFYEKLETEDQKKIIKELREINKITRIEKPYRMTLLEANIPTIFKGAAMKKINSLRYMEPGSGEYYKIKNWVDTFMRIPFNRFESLPITIEDGVEKCHEFMENAKNTLDSATHGLNDAKMQIMQMLGQLITNPKSIGTAIAINGPPGTGKTTLVKEGISKILNRPFAFIALGGATDSSFLEGHSYTYEGSTWGKIVQILIDSKCMNPVIYFDELDKISDTPRGEEITGILTHLTDTSQNSQFHDKYFAEINFDLSKCLFIFSYNDESKVNPILKDRMYRIQTKGYGLKQKTVISKNYLLPKIREQVKFNDSEVIISDETIHHIVDKHCNKEDGVRNLKRCLEIIHTKLNLYRLMKPGSNLFEEDMSLKVEFPFTVTKDIVDKLIKSNSDTFTTWQTMFV
jgi:ATP-dependent Lon protease